jgi:hypothetical protein
LASFKQRLPPYPETRLWLGLMGQEVMIMMMRFLFPQGKRSKATLLTGSAVEKIITVVVTSKERGGASDLLSKKRV